ncbi:MAG TPA: hypothetical protein VL334_10400 [Anaerolineae bacterium]|nr:hypothetical protein [Anaerolineae bacterium]
MILSAWPIKTSKPRPSFQAETQIIVVLTALLRLDDMAQRQLNDLLIAIIQRSSQIGCCAG